MKQNLFNCIGSQAVEARCWSDRSDSRINLIGAANILGLLLVVASLGVGALGFKIGPEGLIRTGGAVLASMLPAFLAQFNHYRYGGDK